MLPNSCYLSGTAWSCRPKTGSSHLETRGDDADNELVVMILEPKLRLNLAPRRDNADFREKVVLRENCHNENFPLDKRPPILLILTWYWIGHNDYSADNDDTFGLRLNFSLQVLIAYNDDNFKSTFLKL